MKFQVGDTVSVQKTFTLEEVLAYAKSSGDTNPVHFDAEYAAKTAFKKPIVQGMFAASIFGGLLGTNLPGKGTILLGQNLKFIKPVYVNESIEATITIRSIRDDKPIIVFEDKITNEAGEVVMTGESVVIYRGEFFQNH
jgi:3-hydroxybutyryl-CoA dehydratase